MSSCLGMKPTFGRSSCTRFPPHSLLKSGQTVGLHPHIHGNFHPDALYHLHSFLGSDGKIPLWHSVSTTSFTWILSQPRYLVYQSFHYPFHYFESWSLGKTFFANYDHYLYDLSSAFHPNFGTACIDPLITHSTLSGNGP